MHGSNRISAADGSDHSFKAADFAIKLAGDYRAKLFVVTVTHIPEKHHVSRLEVIESEARHGEMNDAKKWYEGYTQRGRQNGLLTGYALKKVIKIIAVILGLFMAGLAYLLFSYQNLQVRVELKRMDSVFF